MADVIIAETPEALAERVAADFVALVKESLARQDRPPHDPAGGPATRQGGAPEVWRRPSSGERFSVALAGGVTPKQFYARLAKDPYRSQVPWSKLYFFWGDERCVPKDHPDSNFRMAAESLLQFVPVPPAHVFRMRGEDPPPKAARDYEKELREFFRNADPWPRFDLILLGLGPDGHTASLLAGTPALTEHGDRWVVGNVLRSLQTVRITLTLPAINQASRIWFLVTGAKKAEAFAEVQKGPNPACPASLVKPVNGELRWYVDKAVVEKDQRRMSSSPLVPSKRK